MNESSVTQCISIYVCNQRYIAIFDWILVITRVERCTRGVR